MLDYVFLVGLYFLLRKILFQMANAKRKCTFTNEMQEKQACFRKCRNDTRQNAWFAIEEPIYLSCTNVMMI